MNMMPVSVVLLRPANMVYEFMAKLLIGAYIKISFDL
jgi:hypothetical protein